MASAALPPEAYEQLRTSAPLAFGGVVLNDAGGQAQVRIEHVERGPLAPGQVVIVRYPEHRGQPVPDGAVVYYRRFMNGTRLRVWGRGAPRVDIVHGGVDIVQLSHTPSKSGGCAGCTIASNERSPWAAGWTAALVALLLTRRRQRR